MSTSRVRQEIRSARYRAVNRTGLTIGDLRAFLAEADEAQIPDTERARIEVELAHEGGSQTVRIEASVTVRLADSDDLCDGCVAEVASETQRDTLAGVELIAAERRRQVEAEGWTPEHDTKHWDGELALAAACYALPEAWRSDDIWPWHPGWWKPRPDDRVRELVKAGALIAAEIDRLRAQAVARLDHGITS